MNNDSMTSYLLIDHFLRFSLHEILHLPDSMVICKVSLISRRSELRLDIRT